jgi:NodT family efflux transporter outer membrane factor (OMF) lipoprotein
MRTATTSEWGALVMLLTATGCAVGPPFRPAAPPATEAFAREFLPTQTEATEGLGGEPQRFQLGRDLPGRWWMLFGSTRLNALIDDAMTKYPDIDSQQAALRAARENVRAEQGVFSPQVQGAGNFTREQVSGGSIGPGYPGFMANVSQANVSVSYPFDVFGGERRAVEGLRAQAAVQQFKLEASYLNLTSNVALTVIQVASIRGQIAATGEMIALDDRELAIIKRQFELGSRTRADVQQQQASLAGVRATLPTLRQQLAAAEHQLAVLTGSFPHDAGLAEFDLSDLTLPRDLPVSLPSALVAQRPDIRAQEMMMHEACAAIGVATANMLPQLTLTGAYGGESLRFASLLSPASNAWNIAAGITQPLFDGGRLRAKRRAAIDNYDQASAQYRLIVLQAFQNVADALTALDNDAQALTAEHDALDAAEAGLDLIQKQYRDGAVNYVSLLTAEQAYQQARLAYIRAVAARYSDTVALFEALGGGWWNRRDQRT